MKGSNWRNWVEPDWSPRDAVPLFPASPLVPTSGCPHHRPIRKGSVFVCMVCHQSGMDGHPRLVIHAGERPKPEPRPKCEPTEMPKQPVKLTRKQKRALMYAATNPESV